MPVIAPEADPRTCTPRPFAHLMIGQRQTLRTAYAALLKERVARNAPAVPIPPPRVTGDRGGASPVIPIEGGCMFCGVGHQTVAAVVVARAASRDQVARDLWTPKRAETAQLGGLRSPQSLSGHLCKSCLSALEHAGAIGPTALERAVVTELAPSGVDKLGWGQLRVDGLIGWSVLVARARQPPTQPKPEPKPNERPWEHLGDLAGLSKQLGAALG